MVENLSDNFLSKLNPTVRPQLLLFVAGIVWALAGCILLLKAWQFTDWTLNNLLIYQLISLVGGVLFYIFLFSEISSRHIARLQSFTKDKVCVFSFFNLNSYMLMFLMIGIGILVRKTQVLPNGFLALFYLTMGLPLLISAFRFFTVGIRGFSKS